MFSTAKKTAIRSIDDKPSDREPKLHLLGLALPPEYTLSQIYHDLMSDDQNSRPKSDSNKKEEFASILILNSCLKHSEKFVHEPGDIEAAGQILSWLARVIRPDGNIVSNDELPEDGKQDERSLALQRIRTIAEHGLTATQALLSLDETFSEKMDNQFMLSLLAFTDSRDPWTTTASASITHEILKGASKKLERSEFIVDFLLREFIRPLFSKSKPETITSTGRKATTTNLPRKHFNVVDMDPANKPWKFKEVYSISVFRWLVQITPEDIITDSWPLFIPPLLTLIDDSKSSIRTTGLEILSSFLPKLPTRLLKQTGLGEVFEQAVLPTLLYLPTLTPEHESLKLLPPAYEALYILAAHRYAFEKDEKARIKALDKVMRQGILQGYHHSREHHAIVKVMIEQLGTLTGQMGIHSVKYLKETIPILSGILTDPFASSQPALLISSTKTLQALILNSWPRMTEPGHRNELIKALVLCYSMLLDEDHEASHTPEDVDLLKEVEHELEITGTLLVKAVTGEVDMEAELGPLLKADGRLSVLFGLQTQ